MWMKTAAWSTFTAVGREADRDPYYGHLYRVSLEGGEPELLTPEDADHTVAFAPGGSCFVDNYSMVDQAPVILLRSADGKLIRELERADISELEATGWRAPERFKAKARDGVTDVYGVIFRPSDLDEGAAYPVIDYIYGGPQAIQAPAAFADAARERESNYWQAQALAELGFVVVMIDGLGMPGRSKAHHDHSYRNLPDNGLPDHICAIRQLADRYEYLDISRVGIFGHSAGGYASCRAMFAYPDFYKVAVSSAGNHDHRLDKATWVERYMGLAGGGALCFFRQPEPRGESPGQTAADTRRYGRECACGVDLGGGGRADQSQQGLRSVDHAQSAARLHQASLLCAAALGLFCAAPAGRRSAGGISNQVKERVMRIS